MSRLSDNSPEFTDDASDHSEASFQGDSTDRLADISVADSLDDMSSLKIMEESSSDEAVNAPIVKSKNRKKAAIIDSDSEDEHIPSIHIDSKSPALDAKVRHKSSNIRKAYKPSRIYTDSDSEEVSEKMFKNTPIKKDSLDFSKKSMMTPRTPKAAIIDSDSDSEDELHDLYPGSDNRKDHYSSMNAFKGTPVKNCSWCLGKDVPMSPRNQKEIDKSSSSLSMQDDSMLNNSLDLPITSVKNKSKKTSMIYSESEEEYIPAVDKNSSRPPISDSQVRHKPFNPERISKNLLIESDSEQELHDIYPGSKEYYSPEKVSKATPVKETSLDFRKESMMTPRTQKEAVLSSGSSVEELSDDMDIIELSSDGEEAKLPKPVVNKPVVKQITLDKLVNKLKIENNKTVQSVVEKEDPNSVSPEEHRKQIDKVLQLESDLKRAKNMLQTLNIKNLPDKGKQLLIRHSNLENILKIEKETLGKMVVHKGPIDGGKKAQIVSWEEIEAGASAVQPKTFGKKGIQTYNAQKAMTLDKLEELHSSLKGRPSDKAEATDPKGLKVTLMPHQKTALAWMMWREKQNPSGGILADDMGLGKTLTVISLMLKMREQEDGTDNDSEDESNINRKNYKYPGGTLVVCPASLLNQWSGELERRTSRGLASYEVYHGPKRETKPKRLGEHDMVITTYAIIMNECERSGAVFRVRWKRIILDEAHQIRNHKSQTSEAVCKLSGRSRWALTGTPVHNRELDMYALLKFLKCTPFDDLVVWKRWVGDKSTGGQERLHTVISSLLLRRTKAELIEKGSLKSLPDRKWELISVTLEKNEMDVYSKVLIFSRTLFAQYLHQHADKNQDRIDFNVKGMANDPNSEYFKMRQKLLKFNNVREVKQHEILVLLLRLRQICCHPTLIIGMLQGDEDLGAEEDANNIEEMNLLDQLNKLNLDDQDNRRISGIAQEEVGLKEACKSIFNLSNPVFSDKFRSSKIEIIMNVLKKNVLANNDKGIVVSQWTSLLKIIALHLEKERIPFEQLDGTIPVNKRMAIVDNINNPNHKVKLLLLSLTAGGVGLNLVGANHLLLLDLHWNPQLESQAQDRIYRVGQNKPVHIYKFMAVGTIEERIKNLQDKKLEIAEAMLSGTKQVISNKLSLNDLKMLFEM